MTAGLQKAEVLNGTASGRVVPPKDDNARFGRLIDGQRHPSGEEIAFHVVDAGPSQLGKDFLRATDFVHIDRGLEWTGLNNLCRHGLCDAWIQRLYDERISRIDIPF